MPKYTSVKEFFKAAQALPTVKTNTRLDLGTEDISETELAKQIANLYNLKSKDEEGNVLYDYNIIESAHPKPVVIAPTYDKVNGLVENDNERSAIMQDIATRTPKGNGIPKKYAEKQLLMALVRTANHLDNCNIKDLTSLADVCIEQTSKKLKKEAIAPLVWAGITGAAALLGGVYAKQHLAFISDGFERDHAKLLAEINDVLESNSNFGVGTDYNPTFIKAMQSLQKDCNDFYSIYKIVLPVLEKLNTPKSGKELLEAAKDTSNHEVEDAYKKLNTAANNLMPKLDFLRRNLTNSTYKNMQVQQKGWFSDLADHSGLLGGKGLIADDMDDVSHALETYMKDINDVANILRSAGEYADNAKKQLQQAQEQAAEQQQTTPTQEPVKPESNERSVEDINEQIKELDSFTL